MIPYVDKIITQNLIRDSLDNSARRHTLLNDEACQLCGIELSKQSRQNKVCLCGSCGRKIPRKAFCVSDIDYRINESHGESFIKAFNIAFGLR